MSMTDPIADFLTRIRNGVRAKHVHVEQVFDVKVWVAFHNLDTAVLKVVHDQLLHRQLYGCG